MSILPNPTGCGHYNEAWPSNLVGQIAKFYTVEASKQVGPELEKKKFKRMKRRYVVVFDVRWPLLDDPVLV